MLKQILMKMQRLIDEGKLKLKSDKKRKAEDDVDAILNRNSLGKIYVRCAEVAAKEMAILNSDKMAETKNSLSTFQEETQRLKVKQARIEAHEAVKKRAYNDIIDKIKSHKKAIEKNVQASLSQKIQIL